MWVYFIKGYFWGDKKGRWAGCNDVAETTLGCVYILSFLGVQLLHLSSLSLLIVPFFSYLQESLRGRTQIATSLRILINSPPHPLLNSYHVFQTHPALPHHLPLHPHQCPPRRSRPPTRCTPTFHTDLRFRGFFNSNGTDVCRFLTGICPVYNDAGY